MGGLRRLRRRPRRSPRSSSAAAPPSTPPSDPRVRHPACRFSQTFSCPWRRERRESDGGRVWVWSRGAARARLGPRRRRRGRRRYVGPGEATDRPAGSGEATIPLRRRPAGRAGTSARVVRRPRPPATWTGTGSRLDRSTRRHRRGPPDASVPGGRAARASSTNRCLQLALRCDVADAPCVEQLAEAPPCRHGRARARSSSTRCRAGDRGRRNAARARVERTLGAGRPGATPHRSNRVRATDVRRDPIDDAQVVAREGPTTRGGSRRDGRLGAASTDRCTGSDREAREPEERRRARVRRDGARRDEDGGQHLEAGRHGCTDEPVHAPAVPDPASGSTSVPHRRFRRGDPMPRLRDR